MGGEKDDRDYAEGIEKEAQGDCGSDITDEFKKVESAIEGKHDGEKYAAEYNTKAVAFGGDLKGIVVDEEDECRDVLFCLDELKGCVLTK